ncbi:unnamed protein product [Closterium sp. NIES-65]|nr:unnamed protein product [Closterium sp. NIES-65]
MPRPSAVIDCAVLAHAGHAVPAAMRESVCAGAFMDALGPSASAADLGSSDRESSLVSPCGVRLLRPARAIMGERGRSWASVGDHGRAWGIMGECGRSWASVGDHGRAWASVGERGGSWASVGESWASVGDHGRAWAIMGERGGSLLEDANGAQCGHSFGGSNTRKSHGLAVRSVASCFGKGVLHCTTQGLGGVGHVTTHIVPFSLLTSMSPACVQLCEPEDSGLLGSPDAEGGGRLKGVQFPFSVNEKVLIKDSGESVRLQYRSLQKCDGTPVEAKYEAHHASTAEAQAEEAGAGGDGKSWWGDEGEKRLMGEQPMMGDMSVSQPIIGEISHLAMLSSPPMEGRAAMLTSPPPPNSHAAMMSPPPPMGGRLSSVAESSCFGAAQKQQQAGQLAMPVQGLQEEGGFWGCRGRGVWE